jgi:hypothetical protein
MVRTDPCGVICEVGGNIYRNKVVRSGPMVFEI